MVKVNQVYTTRFGGLYQILGIQSDDVVHVINLKHLNGVESTRRLAHIKKSWTLVGNNYRTHSYKGK